MRLTIDEKLSVLDYLHGPPAHTQRETIQYFNNYTNLKISQSTLSNWLTNEYQLRKLVNDNPNLKNFKKKPVYKRIRHEKLDNNEILDDDNNNNEEEILDIGFSTKLIHSHDWMKSFDWMMDGIDQISPPIQPISPPILQQQYPPQQNQQQFYQQQTISNNPSLPPTSSVSTTLAIENILENITNGHVTLYNSGSSAIMGILTYINPKTIYISDSGSKGTYNVVKLLKKLTNLSIIPLLENIEILPNSVIILESPMNPIGYVQDISHYSKLIQNSNIKTCYLIVDSTLAPPPLQSPFDHGAKFIVYSAVKYLSGVSDLSAGFIVSLKKNDKLGLINERNALNTSIANFDSFLLLRSLRSYKMRIFTQCDNTKLIINYLIDNFNKYKKILKTIHHSSLQLNKSLIKSQLNNYYNPVFALEFINDIIPNQLLKKFNFLSTNPVMEGGETLVELITNNPNFIYSNDLNYKNMLRFSVGCEDYQDIIRDIDQALLLLIN